MYSEKLMRLLSIVKKAMEDSVNTGSNLPKNIQKVVFKDTKPAKGQVSTRKQQLLDDYKKRNGL